MKDNDNISLYRQKELKKYIDNIETATNEIIQLHLSGIAKKDIGHRAELRKKDLIIDQLDKTLTEKTESYEEELTVLKARYYRLCQDVNNYILIDEKGTRKDTLSAREKMIKSANTNGYLSK